MNSWSNGVSSARASRLSTALPEAQPGPAAAAALCVLSRGRRARGEGAARPAHVAASRPARLTCLVEAAQLVESTSGPGRVTRPIGARPASTPGTRGTAGHPAQPGEPMGRFFIFIFFKIVFYRNIFLVLQFTGLYPYRPAGGRQAPRPNIKAEVPPPAFAANNIHRGKNERCGVREGVATTKLCRILDPNRR